MIWVRFGAFPGFLECVLAAFSNDVFLGHFTKFWDVTIRLLQGPVLGVFLPLLGHFHIADSGVSLPVRFGAFSCNLGCLCLVILGRFAAFLAVSLRPF